MAEPPSSPPNETATPEESLAWYKRQYELLGDELAEFRESSHELEAELEKDLDAADKRQRALQQKAEGLQFEVDEWKVSTCLLGRISYIAPLACKSNYVPLGKMQEGKSRGQCGTECFGEGDYESP